MTNDATGSITIGEKAQFYTTEGVDNYGEMTVYGDADLHDPIDIDGHGETRLSVVDESKARVFGP